MVNKKEKVISTGGGGGSEGTGGGGGNGNATPNTYKVTRLMLWPSRKINLGNYSSVDLNAGMEIVFDKPVDINSAEVDEALTQMRTRIRKEFKEQYAPFAKKKPATTNTSAGK